MTYSSSDIETAGRFVARGRGVNQFFGPHEEYEWVRLGPYVTDPDTTNWGTGQAGRAWWNATLASIRYWDGSAIQTVGGPADGSCDVNRMWFGV